MRLLALTFLTLAVLAVFIGSSLGASIFEDLEDELEDILNDDNGT